MSINSFRAGYNALTIFYDQLTESRTQASEMEINLSTIYPIQQHIYKSVSECPSFEQVRSDLQTAMNQVDVLVPDSQDMLFAYYLDLRDLTEQWIDQFHDMAERVRGALGNTGTHHHVICFRYTVSDLTEEERQRLIPLLVELSSRNLMIAKDIFLFRGTFLTNFEDQEKGLAELLFLQSRENAGEISAAMSQAGSNLKMITFDDYYESRAAICQKAIEEINSWESDAVDPDSSAISGQIREILVAGLSDFRKKARGFSTRTTLFPVPVSQFSKTGFLGLGGYQSNIGPNHPLLSKERHTFIESNIARIIGSSDCEAVKTFIKEKYHYKDFTTLKERFSNTGNTEQLVSEIYPEYANSKDDERNFLVKLTEHILEEIGKTVDSMNPEAVRKKKAAERVQRQRELVKAGTYQNLQACLNAIDTKTKLAPLNGIFGNLLYQHAFINGKAVDLIQNGYGSIGDIPSMYIETYPGIAPNEVVVFKVYSICKLDTPDTVMQLNKLIQ